ncbi:MAG: alanine--tRNA ligase [Candidatus Poribacteria bacterium]|nr:alanine--tRNA ligase [Candidatus Poribacteria bacterium]
MTSDEIRSSFLDYFRKQGHTIVPSASLIPADDPTLLFTNAGMNQFKDVFLGIGRRDYKRVADTQKCMRVSGKHNDLEDVGYSRSHQTFFEMLGNWSFGDYYKREAIAFAWELVTEIWKIPKERLWASVHVSDDEAEKLWYEVTDLFAGRVRRFDKDNFWEMGETGPCGPCSELFIDLGPEVCPTPDAAHECGINTCDRFVELWNLVFIQYNRDVEGVLHPLPEKHVDTGMGFERMVSVLQGVDSNYKTDLFVPILEAISNMTNQAYFNDERGVPHRVIADHIRCLTFAIGDGVMPSNEGRGYVIRRILRRAVLYGKRLGMDEPFIYQLVDEVVNLLGHVFPDMLPRRDFIKRIIQGEEGRFHQTLDRGLEILTNSLDELEAQDQSVLPGRRAFELYDTFGFPLDLTQILARERQVTVDEDGFEESMSQQRERSRADWKVAGGDDKSEAIYAEIVKEFGETEFLGYDHTHAEADIIALIRGDELVSSVHEGEAVSVILNRTPFYGESGGQVGDTGVIESENAKLKVVDTAKPAPNLFVHKCEVIAGELVAQATVETQIDAERRQHIAVSHTATHILHHALRTVLGTYVSQAGSLVESGRLRFDFTHYEAVTPEQLHDIERIVNDSVRLNNSVETDYLPLQAAKDRGALAFFGDKYGDMVRMVQISEYSKELCGGTHVRAAGEIGLVKILHESSIAAGVRRVEALTGADAYQQSRSEDDTLAAIANMFKTQKHLAPERVEKLLQSHRELERRMRELQGKLAQSQTSDLVQNAAAVNGFRVIAASLENTDRNGLRHLVDDLKNRIGSGVVVLATAIGTEAAFVVGVTPDLVKSRGLQAGKIIREITRLADGRGGGRPELAQGGSRNPGKMKSAIDAVVNIVANQV